MEVLYWCGLPVLLALYVASFVSMVGQAVHVFMLGTRRDVTPFVAIEAYEMLVALCLTVGTILLRDACQNRGGVALWFGSLVIPDELAGWVFVAPLALGIVLMILCRRPFMAIELAAFVAWLPPCVEALGPVWPRLLMLMTAFFLFRSLSSLVFDYQRRNDMLTRLSVAEAINAIPEGVLCMNKKGRILLMNDAMRDVLARLGRPGLLSDARGLWDGLRHEASFGGGANALSYAGARLQADDGSIWLLSCDSVSIGKQQCERIVAREVTELETLNLRIKEANAELAQAEEDIKTALAMVNEVAAADALARMRARVHDIIGQRLSILHRCLEDGDTSAQTLKHLHGIVDGIMDDLRTSGHPNPSAELDSIVAAFALIKVDVRITGHLPHAGLAASAFVDVIREALTNAVRHAQADVVDVVFEQCADSWTLCVRNQLPDLPGLAADQQRCPDSLIEGTGIPGMRYAIESAGGTLEIVSFPAFEVRANIPRTGATAAQSASFD